MQLGHAGPEVGAVGFGAWGLSGDYGPADDVESVAVIRRAIDLGCDLIDTADEYGAGHNEHLVGRAIRGRSEDVCLATKAGLVRGPDGAIGVCGRPEHVRGAVERSLDRLGVGHVREGKVRFLGLSEVGPELVRRAHAVHRIAAVQSEYSLWTRDAEADVLPALADLGIGFVAFSPLGRGFLAGVVASAADLAEGDFRRTLPRFQPETLERNRALLGPLRALAARTGARPAQLALAWLVHRGVVPIPGTRSLEHLESNACSAGVELGPDDLRELEEGFPPGVAAGERYPPSLRVLAEAGR